MNPVALVTRLQEGDRNPEQPIAILYCSACRMFHPTRCFHRDLSQARGFRYVCSAIRSRTRPKEKARARPYKKKGPCSCGLRRHRQHASSCPRRKRYLPAK